MEITPKVALAVAVKLPIRLYLATQSPDLPYCARFSPSQQRSTLLSLQAPVFGDADAVLKDERKFGDAVEAGRASPRVFVTVGADEPDSPSPPQTFIASLPPVRAQAHETWQHGSESFTAARVTKC